MTPRPAPRPRRHLVTAVLVAWALVLVGCSGDDDGAGDTVPGDEVVATSTTVAAPQTPADALGPLDRLQVGRDGSGPAIVDEQGREVLLRGANLNSLGDYAQANLFLPPTRPPTDEDWDQMAAHGFSVVRLVLSWSALEPARGQVDLGYLQRIQQAVAAAEQRGMYTVLDMHQDAWGKAVASPPDVACAGGDEPAIGGDGAPPWATLTDGADTCHPPGAPEGAPAVSAAFTAFYENRDGIRDAFATTWGALASAFADVAAVAGYDLLNEPAAVTDPLTSARLHTDLVTSVIGQIRAGETQAGGFSHLVFLEPLASFPRPGSLPVEGAVADDQVVFAPHDPTQVPSPSLLTVDQALTAAADAAAEAGWPLWVGEHGVAATDEAALDQVRSFAAAQDRGLTGGAQWQWRQWCGDPATIGAPGRIPTEPQVQLNTVLCPDDVDAGPTPELLEVAGRAYPRATPGRLTELTSDPATRTLSVVGRIVDDLAIGDGLVLWVPGDDRPDVTGEGVGRVVLTEVPGGWWAEVAIDDSPYEVEVT